MMYLLNFANGIQHKINQLDNAQFHQPTLLNQQLCAPMELTCNGTLRNAHGIAQLKLHQLENVYHSKFNHLLMLPLTLLPLTLMPQELFQAQLMPKFQLCAVPSLNHQPAHLVAYGKTPLYQLLQLTIVSLRIQLLLELLLITVLTFTIRTLAITCKLLAIGLLLRMDQPLHQLSHNHCSQLTSAIQLLSIRTLKIQFGKDVFLPQPLLIALPTQDATGLTVKN